MNPNLKWKAFFILAVILFCIYLLFGVPNFPTSLAQVKDNFSHQIKLGLDLQGGTHLILQVQVQEAIAQETDQTVDRLTNELRTTPTDAQLARQWGAGVAGGGAGAGATETGAGAGVCWLRHHQ